jgi:hypothetical protein
MNTQRESFFRCILSSPSSRRVAHVRAWDAGEAVKLFRTELRGDGVKERGTIEVSDFDGAHEPIRARYAP